MSDQSDTNIDDEQELPEDFRAALDRAKQEAAEGAAAKRELAFMKAGVDLDSPQGKLLSKAYDGEPSAEGIQAFAAEMGVELAAPATSSPAPGQAPDPAEDTARRQVAGEAPPAPPTGTSIDQAYEESKQLRAEGRTREESAVPVVGAILQQAAQGNPKYIFDERKWAEEARARGF